MANISRVTDLLREAVNVLSSSPIASSSSTDISTSSSSSSSLSSLRNIFAPYRRRGAPRAIPGGLSLYPKTTWTHKFCCLSNPYQETVPDKPTKKQLTDAGLGEKRMTLTKSKDPQYFRETLYEKFPKLRDGGGFELLRSSARIALEKICMPANGYNTQFLSDESGLGGAICYIRPIQEHLSLEPVVNIEPTEDCIKELCKGCGQNIPIVALREHVAICYENSDEDLPLPPHKKQKDRPICEFACVAERKSDDITFEDKQPTNDQVCPVCTKVFPSHVIETHAAYCGERNQDIILCQEAEDPARSLDEDVAAAFREIEKKSNIWSLSVVRSNFILTATEELKFGKESDWLCPIRVSFLGEEGLDNGGLRREFFTLLFNSSPVFDGKSFTVNSEYLAEKQYTLLGKATALAVLNGHPGPRRFNKHLINYMLMGKEPDMDDVLEIENCNVQAALKMLQSDSGIGEPDDGLLDMLGAAGFKKQLKDSTRVEASRALRLHYGFYMFMGPLLQYMEGLKLHGNLDILRKHREDSMEVLLFADQPALSEVARFFVPSYSSDNCLKAREVMVMYNFNKFLKQVDRELVTSSCLGEGDELCTKTISFKDVLKAFLGCESLPRNTASGLITFDHASNRLSTVNTCGPSITFSNVNDIQDYEKMKVHLLNIIIGAPDFGIE